MGRKLNKEKAYWGLLTWFIAVSGFQYMVGTDVVTYVKEYQELDPRTLSWENIKDYNVQYQPGWMILCYLCRFITKDYVLLKFIQALFLNITVFSFFKRHTKYWFTSIFLYAITDYLVLNFNVMRHSFAVGFSLYAITSMKDSDWKRYAIYTFLAYMFHNSAILLMIFPVIKLFKPTKFSIISISMVFCVFVYAIAHLDLVNLFQNILMSGVVDEGIAHIGLSYMSGDRLGVRESFAVFSLTRILYLIAVFYYLLKYKDPFWGIFGVVYTLFHIIAGFLPILWRYRLYVDLPFLIILSQIIIEFPKQKKFALNTKIVTYSVLILLTFYVSTRDLFYKASSDKYAAIDQYYPYHSIFNPKINRDKLEYFESL